MTDTWQRHAACRGEPTELFFPERGEPTEPARAICAGCPVREPCLQEALTHDTLADIGIWGGTSARERRDLRRQAGGVAAIRETLGLAARGVRYDPAADRTHRCPHCPFRATTRAALHQHKHRHHKPADTRPRGPQPWDEHDDTAAAVLDILTALKNNRAS